MQVFDAFDGGLLVDKPAGPTSHDIVDVIRRQFDIKKVGHCGTLDPNATGLLIINGSAANGAALMQTADADVIQMNKPTPTSP